MRILLLALTLSAPALARPPALVPGDAPELAAPGALPVGVKALSFTAAPGRTLGLTIFYPAAKAGPPTSHAYTIAAAPEGIPATLTFESIASADAVPAPGGKLPLVILSHGLGRWSTAMSGMAENLASKGYIVASIDHDDAGAMDPAKRLTVFATAFMRRSQDQRAAIAHIAMAKDPAVARADTGNIAIIGYSMGGFGVLASVGAGHDRAGPLVTQIPAAAMEPVMEGAAPAPGVRAAILIAPWGGQPQVRSFTPKALAAIRVPSLWIWGDRDDIAGADGIGYLYDHAVASDRWRLVFANARHNLGGNPPPASAPDTARLRDALDEPAWRKDMADAIIYRQMTAFLDMTLKGDTSRRAFLDAGPDGKLPGFPPRWQLGIATAHDTAK